jgi:hypothetical protein
MTELARRYRIDGSSLDLAELIEIGQFFKNGWESRYSSRN